MPDLDMLRVEEVAREVELILEDADRLHDAVDLSAWNQPRDLLFEALVAGLKSGDLPDAVIDLLTAAAQRWAEDHT